MKGGGYDFFVKAVGNHQLIESVREALAQRWEHLATRRYQSLLEDTGESHDRLLTDREREISALSRMFQDLT